MRVDREQRSRLKLTLGWVILGALLSGCAPSPVAAPSAQPAGHASQGGALSVGLNPMDTLDPNKWGGGYDTGVGFQIYDALLDVEASEPRIRPWLAESWTVSTDDRTYTFKLKSGVTFHDGSPFTAQSAQYNLRHLSPSARQGVIADLVANLDDVQAPNPTTLEVRLKAPSTAFLGTLQFIPMISPAAWAQWGDDIGQHPVGTGPFKLKDFVPQDHLSLERNPDYAWPPASSANRGAAYLDTITFKFIGDPPARLVSLESGDSQLITSVPLQDASRIASDAHFKVAKESGPGMPLTLYLNAHTGPLADQQVRVAIQSALDRAELNQAAGYGQSIPASSLLNSAMRCASASISDPYAHDPGHAKQLLDTAGWLPGPDGVRYRDGKPLAFEVAHFQDYANLVAVLQAELKQVGVQLAPKMVASSLALAPLVRGMRADAWIVAQNGNDPSLLANQFHSRTIGNSPMSGAIIPNPQVDTLLDQASAEPDPSRQCELYAQFQQVFLADATAFPIWEITLPVGMASTVEGVRLQPLSGSVPRFQEVYLDH